MTVSTGHLSKLVELAHESSSDKRRELLRDISDLFVNSEEVRASAVPRQITDEILVKLAQDVEASVRAELAERFADHPDAPEELVNDLALDVIEVARPILERSTALREETLTRSVIQHGGEHARAVAGRATLSKAVAEAVAATGDDDALVTLAQNEGAQLSRKAIEHLVDHAERCEQLHAPLVERREMPADLLNEMFFIVKDKLRERIIERSESFDPDTIEAAFAAARQRLSRRTREKDGAFDDAVRFVASKKLRRKLNYELLAELLVAGEPLKFAVAFAELTGVQYAVARRAIDNPAIDPLAIVCRAAAVPRDDFVRIAMLRPTTGVREEADVETLGQVYDALSDAAADRVLRFVKLRVQTSQAA